MYSKARVPKSVVFFGFLCSGEVVCPLDAGFDSSVHLAFGDVALDDPLNQSILEVQLKSLKTDPFRQGVLVVVGRTYSPQGLCPVVANVVYSQRFCPRPSR